MLPFLPLCVVLRFRKRRHESIAAPNRVPSAVIEMEMGVDDDVDVFRGDSGGVEVLEQLGRLLVDLRHLLRQFVADAGFDQDVLVAGAHEQRIQSCIDAVLRIGHDFLRPHCLRNHAEESSAIEEVGSIETTVSSKSPSVVRCIRAAFSFQFSVISYQ